MSKIVTKKLSELFKPINGNSKYTKAYCNDNQGEYIVYTGTTIGIFGKVDKADYFEPNLTFTTDGENAGTIEYITDKGYCIGGHRTILYPIVENIDLLYFKFILQPLIFKNVKQGDVPSVHFNRIKNLEVEVPILVTGEFDLELQKQIAKKYLDIEQQRKTLLRKIEKLKKNNISLESDLNFSCDLVEFNDMFKLKRGKIISKIDILSNSGTYPVYSTQKGIYGKVNTYMEDGEYLLWNTDGLAGYIKKTNGKFSFTNIVGIMLPTGNIDMTNISLSYLKIFLEPIFRLNRKGRMGLNGKNEYTKLNSTMIKNLNIKIPIPIKQDGSYDLDKQQELALKYATLENLKESIYSQLNELVNIRVN